MKLLLSILIISFFSFLSLNANEEVPTKLEVAKLYVATFNRAPDSAGLEYWTNQSGLTLSGIAQSFFDQTETREFYPDGTSNRDFVRSIYLNLFNREPDSLGWDYWEEQLNTGSFSKNRMIEAVINGAQNSDTSNDLDILSNKSTVGLHFANQGLEDPTEARSIMSNITDDVATVNAARDTIDLTGTRLVSAPSGKLVDPYIEGAILCEDVNTNATCDAGEKVSSETTVDGDFGFEDTLTPGTNIIIKTQGIHLGETYDLNIAGVVADDGSIDTVSPLTTLQTKEITNEQIAAIINSAAVNAAIPNWSNISANDVASDPLAGGLKDKVASAISDDDLRQILVNMSVYGLLKVMDGSEALKSLSGNELYVSGTNIDGNVNKIATFMLASLAEFLNSNILSTLSSNVALAKTEAQSFISSSLSMSVDQSDPVAVAQAQAQAAIVQAQFDAAIVDVSAEDIINTALVYMDRFATVGYETCNATSGDATAKVTAALAAVDASMDAVNVSNDMMDIGIKMYTMRNGTNLDSIIGYFDLLNSPSMTQMQNAYNDFTAGNVSYRFNSSNELTPILENRD